jgi:hypothetical protein
LGCPWTWPAAMLVIWLVAFRLLTKNRAHGEKTPPGGEMGGRNGDKPDS